MWGQERVYFDEYAGYISTLLGPPADPAALEELAERIRA